MKNKFKLTGLTCEACVKLVAKRVNKIPGVTEVAIDRETNDCVIEAEREINLEEVDQVLAETDFKAELI